MPEAGLANILAFFSAAAGILLATRFRFSHRQLCALISFASGTLFGAAVFFITPHALEHFSLLTTAAALFSGYALFFLISRYIAHVCPACSATHFEEHEKEHRRDWSLVLLAGALTLHSLLDGLAIVFGHQHGDESISVTILIHKFPEGFALCALLIQAGFSRKHALGLALLLESSTLVGWGLGSFLIQRFGWTDTLDLVLIHAGGGFIFLGLHALLNEVRKHSPVLPIISFAAGMALIIFIH
jgi:zinc and cadmium transporter